MVVGRNDWVGKNYMAKMEKSFSTRGHYLDEDILCNCFVCGDMITLQGNGIYVVNVFRNVVECEMYALILYCDSREATKRNCWTT